MRAPPKVKLVFGLDYDGTITAEPIGFLMFCQNMRNQGHKVYIVTMRYESEAADIIKVWGPHVDGVFCTGVSSQGRQAKRAFMESLGINVNIWIEDNPEAVYKSATEIWGWETPEGHIHTPTHEEGTEFVPSRPIEETTTL